MVGPVPQECHGLRESVVEMACVDGAYALL